MVLLSCFLLEIDLVNISFRSYDPLRYSHVSYNQIIYQNFNLISTKILRRKILITAGLLPDVIRHLLIFSRSEFIFIRSFPPSEV